MKTLPAFHPCAINSDQTHCGHVTHTPRQSSDAVQTYFYRCCWCGNFIDYEFNANSKHGAWLNE